MDASARTLTASLILITTAAILARSYSSSSSSPSDGNDNTTTITSQTKGQRVKRTDEPQYVAGLVNVGNTCFMNAVLQALASLPSLKEYLQDRNDIGHDTDSITQALYETVEMLNVIYRRPTSKKLVKMVKTVKAKAGHVLTSQQQDAQELFQILSSQLSEEREKVDNVTTLSLTESSALMTASVMLDRTEQEKYRRAKSPFMGLLASRVSCVDCGYTAAIRHSTFDNLSLTVPLQYSCSLEHCLDSFIHLDTISDFNCRKCTLLGASKDLGLKIEQGNKFQKQQEEKKVQEQRQTDSGTTMTYSQDSQPQDTEVEDSLTKTEQASTQEAPTRVKKRRSSRPLASPAELSSDDKETSPKPKKISLAEMEQLKARVDQCLACNIEMDLAPIELTPVRSKRTTKHSMIAKPPQALCLHLNRSMFTSSGQMAKNPCRVVFESQLDFTRFTTSGHLTTVPTKSMSRRESLSETVSSNKSTSATNGRVPLTTSASFSGTFSSSPMLSASSLSASPMAFSNHVSRTTGSTATSLTGGDSSKEDEDEDGERVVYRLWSIVVHLGSHNSGHFVTYRRIPSSEDEQPGRRVSNEDKWWRISDEDVQIVEWTLVKNTEAYMLYYEKE
ncbi:hypothetical protein BGZ96_000314 [Linnemannia gamsii]|uniref:Ubiquitin carboxyl-terminal hydrolase n=1 Tax=Linnemannia gamsii TaxID=64522 RepID=A0ABQ7JPS0_9FUNG|nr:hypothetical protein BGZ96_000314 [Linnemannia gamsii]